MVPCLFEICQIWWGFVTFELHTAYCWCFFLTSFSINGKLNKCSVFFSFPCDLGSTLTVWRKSPSARKSLLVFLVLKFCNYRYVWNIYVLLCENRFRLHGSQLQFAVECIFPSVAFNTATQTLFQYWYLGEFWSEIISMKFASRTFVI
jgi:hypothetical protein